MTKLDAIRARLAAATKGPWGWRQTGDKSNDAVLATFTDTKGRRIGGQVEIEEWDDKKNEYRQLADYDETIAYKENDANYADFDLMAHAPTDLAWTLARIEELAAALRSLGARHDDYCQCRPCRAIRALNEEEP